MQPPTLRLFRLLGSSLLLTACLALGGGAHAAPPATSAASTAAKDWTFDVPFKRLGREEGLPAEIATDVVEDAQGFIWVGLLGGGLARWDGYRFKHFRAEPGVPGKLPDNTVFALYCDARGTLWIGTGTGGVVRYDSKTEQFVRHPETGNAGDDKGFSSASARAFVDDGANGLWIGTINGLDHLDLNTGRITHATSRNPATGQTAVWETKRIRALARDRQGTLWIASASGLHRREATADHFEPVPLLPGNAEQPSADQLMVDGKGQVWVSTYQRGAFVIDPTHLERAPVPVRENHSPADEDVLRNAHVADIAEVGPDEVWLGTEHSGIVSIKPSTGETHRIQHIPTWASSLPANGTYRLYVDRSRQVWVTTEHGAAHSLAHPGVSTRFGLRGTKAHMPEDLDVHTALSMPDGRIWLGNRKGSLFILGPDGTLVQTVPQDPNQPEKALPIGSLLDLAQGPAGEVFAATTRGAYRINASGTQVQRVHTPGRDTNAKVNSVLVDGDLLWVLTDDSLWQQNLVSGAARKVQSVNKYMIHLLKADGRLWIATRHGVAALDPRTEQIETFEVDPNSPKGLSSGWANCIWVDAPRRRLLVGTWGGGLDVLSLDQNKPEAAVRLSTKQGLPSNAIYSCQEDGRDKLWLSTDEGLASVNLADLSVTALRRADGVALRAEEAIVRMNDGRMLFGSIGGITIVDPSQLKPWAYRPPIVVTDLQVGGQLMPAGRYTTGEQAVQISPNANNFTVEFAALDYTAPERNHYAHKLEGYDETWVETDATRRLASYTNLPPGNYRLMLLGTNRNGAWSEPTLGMNVRVLPAWYQTWWFRAAMALLAFTLMVAIFRFYTRLLRARQAELERRVSDRTAELVAMGQSLREKSEQLERSSMVDTLTGLYNQRFLTGAVERDLEAHLRWADQVIAAGRTPVDGDSLFFVIEADHLARIHERHGQTAVDRVLVQLGSQLRSVIQPTDHLLRWGDSAFLAVVRDTDRSAAETLAERIRCVVRESSVRANDGRLVNLSCSIGVACLPYLPSHPGTVGWRDVVALAELARQAAVWAGRDAWVGLFAAAVAAPNNALMTNPLVDGVMGLQLALRKGHISIASSKVADTVRNALLAQRSQTSGGHSPTDNIQDHPN